MPAAAHCCHLLVIQNKHRQLSIGEEKRCDLSAFIFWFFIEKQPQNFRFCLQSVSTPCLCHSGSDWPQFTETKHEGMRGGGLWENFVQFQCRTSIITKFKLNCTHTKKPRTEISFPSSPSVHSRFLKLCSRSSAAAFLYKSTATVATLNEAQTNTAGEVAKVNTRQTEIVLCELCGALLSAITCFKIKNWCSFFCCCVDPFP